MAEERIKTEVRNGAGYLIMANPPVNVLSIGVMEEAVEALRELEENPDVKVIVVAAEGTKAYSAGVDISDHTVDKMERMLEIFDELCFGLQRSPKPTVAAVQAMALGGGCEVAACCDMVVASEKAVFGQPEIKVGVFPILGVALFADIMGPKAAAELVLSGENFTAERAEAVGLVNRVVPADGFEASVDEFIASFVDKSGIVLSITKQAMRVAAERSDDEALDAVEDIYINRLMETHDANEGLKAYLEKRKPEWKES